jgi:hypothetical protein
MIDGVYHMGEYSVEITLHMGNPFGNDLCMTNWLILECRP